MASVRLVFVVFALAFCVGFAAGCVGAPPTPCTECDGTCVDLQVDSRNCGACGTVCGGGQVCVGGACKATCPSGQQACGGKCVSLQTDRANCGACGAACAAGRVCDMGACGITCSAGRTNCDGDCVNTQTDRANCGACGTACAAGQACDMGACVVSCSAGRTSCGGDCVNSQTDRANCGACGTACPAGQACSMGRCEPTCAVGRTNCAGDCVDTQTDRANCGACGTTCGAGQVCDMGACVASCGAGRTNCGGACVDRQTDPQHCGACGVACAGANTTGNACVAGACRSLACSPGFHDCDGNPANGCEMSTSDDLYQCGGCGVVCAPQNVMAPPTCAGADAGTPVGDAGVVVLGDGGLCQQPGTPSDAGFPSAGCAADAGLPDGGCAAPRPTPGPGAVCRASACGYAQCRSGYGDCDGNPANGCETFLTAGFCFGTDRSWIFPGGGESRFGSVRPVDFTIVAERPATIFYTLDGTEPTPGRSGTMQAPSPVALPARTAGLITWFARFADGSREETRSQDFRVDAAGQASWGIISENLVFTKSGSAVVIAAPGEVLQGTFRENLWRSSSSGFCPSCITQFTSGVDGVGQTSCNFVSASYPGLTVNRAITVTAPAQPGLYFVRFGLNFQFTCQAAGAGGPAMGLVIVR